MKPEEFVQKWLPNYWERYKERIISDNRLTSVPDMNKWVLEQFDEALETFAKAQRQICAEKCKDEVDDFMYYEILNAPMP